MHLIIFIFNSWLSFFEGLNLFCLDRFIKSAGVTFPYLSFHNCSTRKIVLFFKGFDNDLLTTTGRSQCWRWKLLCFQTAGYWRVNRSQRWQRWQIYNLWRQSVTHIIRQLNHKVALASAVIIPARENGVCQGQGKGEKQGESWASYRTP